MLVDSCLYGFALSGTLLVYSSCYVDKEDRGGLDPFVYKSVLREGEALSFTYSGLKNRCNVLQFWSGCDVALEKARIMLSVGRVK